MEVELIIEYLAQKVYFGYWNQNFLVDIHYNDNKYTYGCCLIVLNIFLYFDSSVFENTRKIGQYLIYHLHVKIIVCRYDTLRQSIQYDGCI